MATFKATDLNILRKDSSWVNIYSITAILLDLQLPSFETLLYNYKYSFYVQFLCSDNAVVKYFVRIGL